jgi:hypothetical protein
VTAINERTKVILKVNEYLDTMNNTNEQQLLDIQKVKDPQLVNTQYARPIPHQTRTPGFPPSAVDPRLTTSTSRDFQRKGFQRDWDQSIYPYIIKAVPIPGVLQRTQSTTLTH